MAIAFGAASGIVTLTGGTGTLSFTCSGSDRALVVECYMIGASSGNPPITVDYNGDSMTKVDSYYDGVNKSVSLFLLLNPDSGTHDINFTYTNGDACRACAVSYTGVDQSSQPDGHITANDNTSPYSVTLTSSDDKCWMIGAWAQGSYGANFGAGTGTTIRTSSPYLLGIGDSNSAITPAGSYTLNATLGGNVNTDMVAMTLTPSPTVFNSGLLTMFP